MFARLLREHNADHSAEDDAAEGGALEGAGSLPPGEPAILMRADTQAIADRAAAEALGASGRTGGDSGVQQARMLTAPTFGPGQLAAAAKETEVPKGTEMSSKYGKQLVRLETMIQQNKDRREGGGKGKGKGGKVSAS